MKTSKKLQEAVDAFNKLYKIGNELIVVDDFGNENVRIFYEKYFLDSSYLQLLFENGIIGFSMLTILISFGMYIFFENLLSKTA